MIDFLKKQTPEATAIIKGGDLYPDIHGTVRFYQTNDGVFITADIKGLPHDADVCHSKIFGFHIHEGSSCAGTALAPFESTGGHYDKFNFGHPHHAGDMPPLFGNNGKAFMSFLTNRFSVSDIVGKTIVIHSLPDDFVTQPSGNSGTKIACGKIKRPFLSF